MVSPSPPNHRFRNKTYSAKLWCCSVLLAFATACYLRNNFNARSYTHTANYVLHESSPALMRSERMVLRNKSRPMAASMKMKLSSSASSLPNQFFDNGQHDSFQQHAENTVKLTSEEPVSTFSVDVDTSSYSFVRRSINDANNQEINKDAVRVEEMINYFDYDYPKPQTKQVPFETSVAVSPSPWRKEGSEQKLIHIGIKGYNVESYDDNGTLSKPKSNLVFLIDVSGSMGGPDRLPLVVKSLEMLLSTLGPDDHVAIATYNHEARVELHSTPVREKGTILNVLAKLRAGGGTGGAGGLRLAYKLAEANFDKTAGTVNRVFLATDGDFNVGETDDNELQKFIESKRKTGIFLSVLGYGMGNYKDSRMQTLANHGNGVAAYIDTINEAHKVLVEQASSTLFPIAKDVKIQVEFNPAKVAEYRLIGYEKRILQREDFNNDNVDAGEIGSGHTVTAIYEITPTDSKIRLVDESRYATKEARKLQGGGEEENSIDNELGYIKIRYKLPDQDTSTLVSTRITDENDTASETTLTNEFCFATAVAGFAQILKGNKYIDYTVFTIDSVLEIAQNCKGPDQYGYRSEFIGLVRKASMMLV